MQAVIAVVVCSALAVGSAHAKLSSLDRDLLQAVRAGQTAQVEAMLKRGADINATHPPWQLTPLLVAVEASADTTKLLVARGADVNAQDREGITVLMKAVARRDAALVALLLDAGARIDATDRRGHTALTHAVLHADVAMLKLLIARGATIDVVTGMGTTPWSMAQEMHAAATTMRDEAKAPHHHHDQPQPSSPAAHAMRSKQEALAQTQAVLAVLREAGATRPAQSVGSFDAMDHHHH